MRKLAAALSCAALCLAAGGAAESAAPRALHVTMIDVEGGQATLFVTPEGKSLLVDTGWPAGLGGSTQSSAERIAAAARREGLKQIDYLLITHYHGDHVGGVADLLAAMPVGTVLDHGPNRELAPTDSATPVRDGHPSKAYPRYLQLIAGHPHRELKPGDRLNLGGLALTFLSSDGAVIQSGGSGPGPQPACAQDHAPPGVEDENPRSAGFVAAWGKARILDLGDLTWSRESLLACPVNRVGPIDLLIVSHHGSDLSTSPVLLAAAAPRVALMDNGPRKGGDRRVFEALAGAPSRPVLWQAHTATRDPDVNRPADFIANLDGEADAGHAITAEVFEDGAIRVANPRNGFTQTYPKR